MIGNAASDFIDASAVDTFIYLVGGGGDDRLSGSIAGGSLRGDAGADTLIGGNGANHMEGGADADLFVLGAPGSLNYIYDFDAAEGDRIDASASGVVAVADLAFDTNYGGNWVGVLHNGERIALVHTALPLTGATFEF